MFQVVCPVRTTKRNLSMPRFEPGPQRAPNISIQIRYLPSHHGNLPEFSQLPVAT